MAVLNLSYVWLTNDGKIKAKETDLTGNIYSVLSVLFAFWLALHA